MREQKGITLIALVITIIVLLILAGVTIAMLSGENGILTNANKSSCSNAYYGAQEQMGLAYMTVRTEIMAKKTATSTYTPSTDADLLTLVQNDLAGNSKFAASKPNANTIQIVYTDNNIDQGLISDSKNYYGATGKTPAHDTTVTATIALDDAKQTAVYTFDI